MTLFQHTLGALLRGEKTETSRLALPEPDGETMIGTEMICYPSGILSVCQGRGMRWIPKWQVGKDYAIQPARGVKSIGRYRIENIWKQDVRTLTKEQIAAEGFGTHIEARWDFLQVWRGMHDKQFNFEFNPALVDYVWYMGKRPRLTGKRWGNLVGWEQLQDVINNRPAERYTAWRMQITVLYDTIDWDAEAVQHIKFDVNHIGKIQTRNGFTQ